MTNQSKYAWPEKQYDGNTAGYEEHETDVQTWLIDKGYDRFMQEVNPRTIPRVERNYQVRRADDPSGQPIGMWIYWETVDRYERRCQRYEEKAKKVWARMMRGYTGAARNTALQAPAHDPQALFAIIKKIHGDKSEKQVTKLVRKFIGKEKSPGKSIEDFNREFTDSVRIMRANGMDLPGKFLVNLYLISLGQQYSTLEAVVSVLRPEERTLVNVMARAIDHNTDTDEADNRAIALIAQLQTEVKELKRGREGAFAAESTDRVICSNCKKPWHTKEQCWAPGGGLSHLTSQQKHDLLQAKKKRRTAREPPKADGGAHIAAEQQKPEEGLVAALEAKIAEQKEQMEFAKARVNGVIDIGF